MSNPGYFDGYYLYYRISTEFPGEDIPLFTPEIKDPDGISLYTPVEYTFKNDSLGYSKAVTQWKEEGRVAVPFSLWNDNRATWQDWYVIAEYEDQQGNKEILDSRGVLTVAKTDDWQAPKGNQAPTDIFLSSLSFPENTYSPVLTVSTSDPDSGDKHTYELVSGYGDDDNHLFSLTNYEQDIDFWAVGDGFPMDLPGGAPDLAIPWDLTFNGSADYESKSSYSIRLQTKDSGGLTYEKSFVVSVIDVDESPANRAPTAIEPSAYSFMENIDDNTSVARLTTSDPDANDTFIYSLVSGSGDVDNSHFTIQGDQLTINKSPDYETKSSYSIRLRATDSGGLSVDQSFNLKIEDQDEIPYLVRGNSIYTIIDGPSWQDAEVNSVKLGGHLVNIGSKEEDDFLTDLIRNYPPVNRPVFDQVDSLTLHYDTPEIVGRSFYIGLMRPHEFSIFLESFALTSTDLEKQQPNRLEDVVVNSDRTRWSDGELGDYRGDISAWNYFARRSDPRRHWGGFSSPALYYSKIGSGLGDSGQWSNSSADMNWNTPGAYYGNLYSYKSDQGIAEIPFIRRGDSAYVIVEGSTWEEAELNAQKLGGHLVTVDDEEEDVWLSDFLAEKQDDLGLEAKAYSYSTYKLNVPDDERGVHVTDDGRGGFVAVYEPSLPNQDWIEKQDHSINLSPGFWIGLRRYTQNALSRPYIISLPSQVDSRDSIFIPSSPGLTWSSGENSDYVAPISEHNSFVANFKPWEPISATTSIEYDNTGFYFKVGSDGDISNGWGVTQVNREERYYGTVYPYSSEKMVNYGIAEIKLAPNHIPTGTPTLSGSAKVGQVLTIDKTPIQDADNFEGWTPTYKYTWEVANDPGMTTMMPAWESLTTADATDGDENLEITEDLTGKLIRGVVSYVDGYGSNESIPTTGQTVEVLKDTTPPTITLTTSKSSLTAGEQATLTFNLSEDSTDFILTDINVSGGGTLSNFQGSGKNYTATFTPKPNSTTASIISVGNNAFSDSAGNFNADGIEPNNKVTLLIDTVVAPGVKINLPSDLTTDENGKSVEIPLVLKTQPSASVRLDLTLSEGAEASLSQSFLEFSTGNWATPQTIRIIGAEDYVDDPDQPYTLAIAGLSTDKNYQTSGDSKGLQVPAINLINLDDGEDVGEDIYGDDNSIATNDNLRGTEGLDRIYGLLNNDTIYGGPGNDLLYGGEGQDIIYGELGNDSLFGESSADSIYGGYGNDTLNGGNGTDLLIGGIGDDTYHVNGTEDTIDDQGNDSDVNTVILSGTIASYELPSDIKNAKLAENSNPRLEGNAKDNLIVGNELDNFIRGGTGNDTLLGGGGKDTLIGGEGRDTADYRPWLPSFLFDEFEVPDYYISLGEEDYDESLAQVANSVEAVNQGSDVIATSIASRGSVLSGFLGIDSVPTAGVTVSRPVRPVPITPEGAGGDTATSTPRPATELLNDVLFAIEDLITSEGDDVLIGNSKDNRLDAGVGDDLVKGLGGNDQLVGGPGNDSLDGGPGNDEAIYSGSRENYSVAYDSETSIVTVSDSRQYHDGTDTVTGVESFKFADITLALDDLIGQASLSDQSTMDFTGDGIVDSTDALLMMRHMMGTFPGEAITQGIPGIADAEGLRQKIMSNMEQSNALGGGRRMDIDGDGIINPLSDGLAMTHYIHRKGLPGGPPQMPDVFKNPMRGFDDMQKHLDDLIGF